MEVVLPAIVGEAIPALLDRDDLANLAVRQFEKRALAMITNLQCELSLNLELHLWLTRSPKPMDPGVDRLITSRKCSGVIYVFLVVQMTFSLIAWAIPHSSRHRQAPTLQAQPFNCYLFLTLSDGHFPL